MHARLTTTTVGDETESIAQIFEHVTPALRDLDGYRGAVVLRDVEAARVLVLTLWESAEAMEGSEATASQIKAAETANRDFAIESTSRYRVEAFDLAR
jgi:heme-degrading monooxygenase HmoA